MDKLRGLVASFTFEVELDSKEYCNGIVGRTYIKRSLLLSWPLDDSISNWSHRNSWSICTTWVMDGLSLPFFITQKRESSTSFENSFGSNAPFIFWSANSWIWLDLHDVITYINTNKSSQFVNKFVNNSFLCEHEWKKEI